MSTNCIPSLATVKEKVITHRLSKKEYVLFFTLILFSFIPSINQLIVDAHISGMGGDVLTIAGQIEWFDLFNETLLAFLTVPMYFVLNKSRDDADLSKRINNTFLAGFVFYTIVSIVIYIYANTLTAYMTAPEESVNYLRLETIGFIIGYVSSYMYVVFVVRGKPQYFVTLVIVKIAMLSIGNTFLIDSMGVTGVAITNILVNAIIAVISIVFLYRDGLVRLRFDPDKEIFREWFRTGFFSGCQVLVANIVYVCVVMKMINDVSEMGNYWLANNFIWGWLLIPIMALGEIIKREYKNGYNKIWNYIGIACIIFIVWALSIPLWNVMFVDVIHAEDPNGILNILWTLVPFYVPYGLSVVFQSVMTAVGRTDLLLIEYMIVNFVYYGIMYGLYLAGVFTESITFVTMLFGMGLVVCLALDIPFYLYSKKKIQSESNAI